MELDIEAGLRAPELESLPLWEGRRFGRKSRLVTGGRDALMAPDRGGVAVVLRDRESWSHGKRRQRDSSEAANATSTSSATGDQSATSVATP
ncbi:hypothetical protein ABZ656_54330 [Streptomyces sp. NPDC007095]|jgi:hypothetical protein|uniref:hypothetical protein n=1 Tax=Streptomyces sp. NPDC007095 TaxID=3154482 RepID=UPI000CB92A93